MRPPLEPDAQAIVDRLAALQQPVAEGETPPPMDIEASRQGLAMFMQMGSGGPYEMASVEDRAVPGPAGDMQVRIYRPTADDGLPLVMFFHGGGWVLGSIETHDGVARQLALGAGAVVVSVDYRLAPDHPFPAATDDALAATRWAHEHAVELGADPARLAVAGDSAGGNLAAVTSLRARDEGGPPLVFQLLVYPVTDSRMDTASYQENASGYFLTADSMRSFWGSYLRGPDDATHPYASPMHADDLGGLPPALVITAGYDPLRDEGEAYAERLRQAGVDAHSSQYEGAIHVFFGMSAMFAASGRAMEEACAALRAAFATN